MNRRKCYIAIEIRSYHLSIQRLSDSHLTHQIGVKKSYHMFAFFLIRMFIDYHTRVFHFSLFSCKHLRFCSYMVRPFPGRELRCK